MHPGETGFQNLGNSCFWNAESGKFFSWNLKPRLWNSEYSSGNPESRYTDWNPESKVWNLGSQTVLASLSWAFNLSFVNSPVFYFTMATSAPSQAFVQLSSSEEGNWLSLGRALTSVLCQGLRPYIKREIDLFYSNVTAAMTALRAGPCTCVYDPSRKKNQHHDMNTCAWAQILQGVHILKKPNWKQSDSSKWIDPSKGKWEIAKLFLPDIGVNTVMESAEDLDITGILNLLYWCNHFLVQRALIEGVRETRNTKWVHVPKLELNDKEKRAAFQTIEKLLQDPVFVGDVDVQNALQDILALKYTSDVQIFKAEVLSHFKEAIRSDMSSLRSEMKSLRKEANKNEKQRARVEGQLQNLKTSLKKVEQKTEETTFSSLVLPVLKLAMTISILFVKTVGGIQQKSFNDCLYLLILFCCIGIPDESSHNDGMLGKNLFFSLLVCLFVWFLRSTDSFIQTLCSFFAL